MWGWGGAQSIPVSPSPPQAVAHEIYAELVEDACLGLCFEVHRAVKCGYFFLDDTDPDSTKDFGGGGTRGGLGGFGGSWGHGDAGTEL